VTQFTMGPRASGSHDPPEVMAGAADGAGTEGAVDPLPPPELGTLDREGALLAGVEGDGALPLPGIATATAPATMPVATRAAAPAQIVTRRTQASPLSRRSSADSDRYVISRSSQKTLEGPCARY
jgi:hypothetical protein